MFACSTHHFSPLTLLPPARLLCMSTPMLLRCPFDRQSPASLPSHPLQTPLPCNLISLLPLISLPVDLLILHVPCQGWQPPIVSVLARSVQCPCQPPLGPPLHAQNLNRNAACDRFLPPKLLGGSPRTHHTPNLNIEKLPSSILLSCPAFRRLLGTEYPWAIVSRMG